MSTVDPASPDPVLTLSLPKSLWLHVFGVIGKLPHEQVAVFVQSASAQLWPQIVATDPPATPAPAPAPEAEKVLQ